MWNEYLGLYDYRLRVKAMYERRDLALAKHDEPVEIARTFRGDRDDVFRTHAHSALDTEQKVTFKGLQYFPYDPEASVRASIRAVSNGEARAFANEEENFKLIPAGELRFTIFGNDACLTLFWIQVYGGGLFLPFVDASAPQETYGGGRYLVDTIKGSTFPGRFDPRDGVVLDFNYAYNPSCAYNSRWVCPLAPPENRLAIAIPAGEKSFRLRAKTQDFGDSSV